MGGAVLLNIVNLVRQTIFAYIHVDVVGQAGVARNLNLIDYCEFNL